MAFSDLWTVELLVAAFAGGAFGAAIGALPSFALTGLLVVLGETAALARRGLEATALPVDLTAAVAFGPVFGPHVAFAGGTAAAAYVARNEAPTPDFEYHPAKRITRGLGCRPDVLAVGRAFGVVGFAVAAVAPALGVPTDSVALGVVGSALAHRLAFGYSVFGAGPRALLDLSGFTTEHSRGPSRSVTAGGPGPRPRPGCPTSTDGRTSSRSGWSWASSRASSPTAPVVPSSRSG